MQLALGQFSTKISLIEGIFATSKLFCKMSVSLSKKWGIKVSDWRESRTNTCACFLYLRYLFSCASNLLRSKTFHGIPPDWPFFGFLVVSKAEFIFSFFQGFYWIDPNGGLIKDAVKVRCERRTRSTCLYPLNANQVKFITILNE